MRNGNEEETAKRKKRRIRGRVEKVAISKKPTCPNLKSSIPNKQEPRNSPTSAVHEPSLPCLRTRIHTTKDAPSVTHATLYYGWLAASESFFRSSSYKPAAHESAKPRPARSGQASRQPTHGPSSSAGTANLGYAARPPQKYSICDRDDIMSRHP